MVAPHDILKKMDMLRQYLFVYYVGEYLFKRAEILYRSS